MPDKVVKNRLNPFKVLVLLHWGTYDFVDPLAQNDYRIQVGPFARHLRVTNYRLGQYLDWLNEHGFVSILGRGHGYMDIRLHEPPNIEFQPEEIGPDE